MQVLPLFPPWNEPHWPRRMARARNLKNVPVAILGIVVWVVLIVPTIFGLALLIGHVAVVLEPNLQPGRAADQALRNISAVEVSAGACGGKGQRMERLAGQAEERWAEEILIYPINPHLIWPIP